MANRKASQAQVFVVNGPSPRSTTPRKSSARRSTKSNTRSAPHRTTTTQHRTVSEVARSGSKANNTPYVVGAGVLALAGLLLYAGRANAAPNPELPPGGGVGPQGPQGLPGAPGAFPQAPGGPAGYAGPGTYRVTAPNGLGVRPAPVAPPGTSATQYLPLGTNVTVAGPAANGWVQITSPTQGFMCISCSDAPGGPWLQRTA